MARKPEQLQSDVNQLNHATNSVASTVKQLRERIHPGLTAGDVADLHRDIDSVHQRLTSLGSDPENPVPGGPDGLTPATEPQPVAATHQPVVQPGQPAPAPAAAKPAANPTPAK